MSTDLSIRRNARDRAAAVLVRSYEGQAFCHDLLAAMQVDDPLSGADAALAAELAIGISRHRLTCEHIAAHFFRGRWAGVRVPVRVILALGVYQLCWLERVPDHAAVDQTVRQAKRYGRGQAAMANAVLRKVIQSRGDIISRPADADLRRFLKIDNTRGRLFNVNIFPDPSRRPLDYLVVSTSHPPWLIERWHRRFKPALCKQICQAGNRRPPLTLRPNTTRISAKDLCDRIVSDGHTAVLSDDGDAVLLCHSPPATLITQIHDGLCQPQDLTAQIPIRLAALRQGELVVDLCAGVGTKTTQAAEMMNNEGLVIATDKSPDKLTATAAAARRLGLSIVHVVPLDQLADALAEAGKSPDVILVDVPCLNTGVLARRPEARYRAGQKALMEIVGIQREILARADVLAGPTTRIVYATCSLESEENEQQVESFCEAAGDWCVREQALTHPNETQDGGFAAVLVKSKLSSPLAQKPKE